MGFIFGGNTGETAESIAQKREYARAMLYNATRRTPQNVGEGLAAIGQALSSRFASNYADKKQAEGESGWQNTFGSAFGMGGAAEEPEKGKGIAGFFGYKPKEPPLSQTNPLAAYKPGQTGAEMPQVSSSGNIPPVNISGNKETFVSSLLPAAIEESKRTGVDPRIIVAQAAQETGWGKSAPGNNYFGIKSHGQGGGQNLTTHEVIKGQRVKINDSFRTFESPEDSVRGYGDFLLNNPRYGKMRSAQGLDNQLAELQASGYATDPNYSRSVGAIARGIQLPEQQPQTGLEAIESIAPINGFAPTQNAPQPAMQPEQPPMVSRPGAITQENFNERFGPTPTQANPVTAQPQPSRQPETDVPLAFQGSKQLMNARGGLADVLLGRSPSTATPYQDQPAAPQPAQAQSKPDLNYLIRARSSPFIPESMKPILDQMIETQMQEQQAAKEEQAWRARQDYENQQRQNDPAYQMGLKKTQLELREMENPRPEYDFEKTDDGAIVRIDKRAGKVEPVYQGGPKPPTPTDDMREYEYAKQQGFQGSLVDYQQGMKKAGASNINLGGGSDKQVFEAVGDSAKSARAAANGIRSIQEARKAVSAGAVFGAGADTVLGLRKVGAVFGVGDPNMITNTETFRAAIAPQVAAMLQSTVGTANISNSDREFAEKAAGGSITLDEGTVVRLLDIMERAQTGVLQSHTDRLNKVYPDGPEFARERALFSVDAPPPIPGSPSRVQSPQDYQALPSGTTYQAPDGTIRTKP